MDETNNHFVNNKDLQILVIASIQTLKEETRNAEEKKSTG